MGWICYGGVFYFFGSNSFSDVCYAMLEMVWTKNGDWLSLCFLVCELPYRELERRIGVIP